MSTRLYRQRKRKEWRTRALNATLEVCTWPTGKPGRDAAEKSAIRAQDKVRAWFTSTRCDLVLSAIHRRGLSAFRQQENKYE